MKAYLTIYGSIYDDLCMRLWFLLETEIELLQHRSITSSWNEDFSLWLANIDYPKKWKVTTEPKHIQKHIQNPIKHLRRSFTKMVNVEKSKTIFAKRCILDIWQGSGCTTDIDRRLSQLSLIWGSTTISLTATPSQYPSIHPTYNVGEKAAWIKDHFVTSVIITFTPGRLTLPCKAPM